MPRTELSPGATTANRILDVAERLAQTRGFNGFSYADVAPEIGITTASLHYHFPSKADLGRALVERYTDAFQASLREIAGAPTDAPTKLRKYVQIYQQVLGADRMCLCGMFAAEYATLPEPVQAELLRFFDENERWLAAVFDEGLREGSLRFDGASRDAAHLLTSALEGAMLLARTYGDNARFRATLDRVLATLTGAWQPETPPETA
ncbi:MAG: TetR/AcrR family transcriptional regulator [Actinomycetota bacterium]